GSPRTACRGRAGRRRRTTGRAACLRQPGPRCAGAVRVSSWRPPLRASGGAVPGYAAASRARCSVSGDERGELLREGGLGPGTDERGDEPTVPEQRQRGDRDAPVRPGRVRVLVDVERNDAEAVTVA